MLTTNMTQLFNKLDDLKSVFTYGQKIIPIIQNLVDFMKDTIPLLENINHSIADSTSKIPKASHQISNVTHATELATTEILDLVDVISNEVGKLEKKFKNEIELNSQKSELFEKLLVVVKGNEEAEDIIRQLKDLQEQNVKMDQVTDPIEKIKNDAYNITISLQVQDITAQQLAAVNHLIESVQTKLSELIIEIQNAEIREPESLSIEAPTNAAFNPDARYKKNGESQKLADSLVNESRNASQDEIDKLFS